MPNFRLALAASIALSLAAGTAGAQQTAAAPSTPFHAGQWALQGDVNGQFGLGLLRFSSPTRALALTVGGRLQRETREVPNFTGGTIENSDWGGNLTASLGARRYHPVAPAVALFNTIGVSGSYSRFPTGYTLGGGPFVDLGGQYLVGQRLSVGVSSALTLFYSNTSYGGDFDLGTRTLTLQGGLTKVSATVYF